MEASDSWRGGIPTRARMAAGKHSISSEACRSDHLPLDLPEDPRRNPFHLRVDGDDPAGMDRVGRVFLGEDLRVVHFGEEAEPARGSAERHRLSDAEPFGEGGVEAEPFRGEAPGTVGDHDLEDPGRAEPFSAALHGKDLPADGYGHPRLEFPDGNHLAPVFVIPREEVEGVVRRPDPPGGKLFPQAGPHPLDVLDGIRCGHRALCVPRAAFQSHRPVGRSHRPVGRVVPWYSWRLRTDRSSAIRAEIARETARAAARVVKYGML